jgi:hypothetical protein
MYKCQSALQSDCCAVNLQDLSLGYCCGLWHLARMCRGGYEGVCCGWRGAKQGIDLLSPYFYCDICSINPYGTELYGIASSSACICAKVGSKFHGSDTRLISAEYLLHGQA